MKNRFGVNDFVIGKRRVAIIGRYLDSYTYLGNVVYFAVCIYIYKYRYIMSCYWPDDYCVSFRMEITLRDIILGFTTQSDIPNIESNNN